MSTMAKAMIQPTELRINILVHQASCRHHLLELAVLHHFLHDVQAADELAVDDQLRKRRPVVERLHPCAHLLVREDVEVRERHALVLQQPDDAPREAAPRRVRLALHEEDDLVLVHERAQTLVQLLLRLLLLGERLGCGGRAVGLRQGLDGGGGFGVLGNCVGEGGCVCARDAPEEGVPLCAGA